MNGRVSKMLNKVAMATKKTRKELKKSWNEMPRNLRSIKYLEYVLFKAKGNDL